MLAPTEYLNRYDRSVSTDICVKTSVSHMKRIGGNINHQKSLKTKMPPFYGILTFILIRQSRQNRPDIIVKNHNDKICFLIDMSVPSDTNVSLKIFEKISKYKDLEIEVTKMWHLKTTTLPVVIGALGIYI